MPNEAKPSTSDFKRGFRWDSHSQRGLARLEAAFAGPDRRAILRKMLRACPADGATAALVQAVYDWNKNVPLNESNLIEAMELRPRRNWAPIELWVAGTNLKTVAFNCSNWPLPQEPA